MNSYTTRQTHKKFYKLIDEDTPFIIQKNLKPYRVVIDYEVFERLTKLNNNTALSSNVAPIEQPELGGTARTEYPQGGDAGALTIDDMQKAKEALEKEPMKPTPRPNINLLPKKPSLWQRFTAFLGKDLEEVV